MMLLWLLTMGAACGAREDVHFYPQGNFSPSPTVRVDVFIHHAPSQPYRIVGLITVNPEWSLEEAANAAGTAGHSLGCELVTTTREGAVAMRAGERIQIASIGSWGSFGSSSDHHWGSSGYTGEHDSDPYIDPRARKFWCGVYVQPRYEPDQA